jgi:hypothetical protein
MEETLRFAFFNHLIARDMEETTFCKNLLNYIRLKEKSDFSKLKRVEREKVREFIGYEMDCSETDLVISSSTMDKCKHLETTKNIIIDQTKWDTYEDVWLRIENHLSSQKNFENIDTYIIKYTNILKSHIDHRVKLDKLCSLALVSSVRPSFIEEAFNLNLIDENTDVASLFRDGRNIFEFYKDV